MHDLSISFFHTAKIPAEAILIQLFTGGRIPQSAGIRADFIRKNDGTIAESAKFQFKVYQRDTAGFPERLE